MLRYVLHIKGNPYYTQSSRTALRFAEALVKKGHTLYEVFFSGEAVVIANKYAQTPTDEECLRAAWVKVAAACNVELHLCSSAAQRRGIIAQEDAKQFHFSDANLSDGYYIAGLAVLVEAIASGDRVLTFG